ncbi:MAG TPA: hypothetical protein VIK89_05735 [Cytophagaceae bacterium]
MAKNSKQTSGIRRDWQTIALCLLAAATFWFFNAMNEDYTANISYPMEIVYDRNQVIPINELPSEVTFNATGFGWDLLKKSLMIGSKPIYLKPANIQDRGYITSSELLPVLASQIEDVRVNYIIQDTLHFAFEPLRSKKVRVVIDSAKISLAPNYKLTTPVIINPDSIMFIGPASMIDSLSDSLLVPLKQKDIKGVFEEEIKLDLVLKPELKVNTNSLKVRFDAYPFVQQSQILKLRKKNFPDDTSIVVLDSTVILTYFIQEGNKARVMPEEFKAVLDYRELDKRDYTIKPKLSRMPGGIRDYYFTPSAIKIGNSQ